MIAAASAAFGIVFLEITEAVVGTSVVGVSRGWQGALIGAGVAVVCALAFGALVASGAVVLPVTPLKIAAGVLLIVFGGYVLSGVV